MARPDLITCSIGAERAAWVRASGFALSKAVQRLIDAERGAAFCERTSPPLQDPRTAKIAHVPDPSDVLPDPPPAAGHEWAWTGRWTARAPSLDEAVRLRDEMRGRGGDARLAAPYVLLVAEVSNGS